MRHASLYFSKQLRSPEWQGKCWDVVVCSDMLNVAEFKGLVGRELSTLPVVVYFHENQFAYPTRAGYHRDQHFPFTNFTTALAADAIWFNSRFNFDSMLEGLDRQTKRWPDYQPRNAIASLQAKLAVQPPGIDCPPVDVKRCLRMRNERAADKRPMRIVWAARWEHDKNAEDLLEALKILTQNGIPFEISVIGQTFRNLPSVFDDIQKTFTSQILRWGYQESREEYWEALGEADIFVSTANHEFFGLAAAEAMAVGLHPVFPDRLAYPELLGLAVDAGETHEYLYDGTAACLARNLSILHTQRIAGRRVYDLSMAEKLLNVIRWDRRAVELDSALASVAGQS